MDNYLISIVGPTGIGKTNLSLKLAYYFNSEIISSDSRQFYKEIPIGTPAPTLVELKSANDLNKVDRIGISQKKMQILDVDIPLVEIPVAAGRDTARLIGVAALDLQLRKIGYDMADEFNQRLLSQMNLNPDG